jgi:hypothetical protein
VINEEWEKKLTEFRERMIRDREEALEKERIKN